MKIPLTAAQSLNARHFMRACQAINRVPLGGLEGEKDRLFFFITTVSEKTALRIKALVERGREADRKLTRKQKAKK